MEKFTKLILLLTLSASSAPGFLANGAEVKSGQKIVVDNMVYVVRDWFYSDAEKWGHAVELRGASDAFYMPSLLKVPDEITYEGEKMMVYSVDGDKYDANGAYIPFEGSNDIVKIELGKNVQTVRGFRDCKELMSVKLNEGLKTIEYAAFQNTALTSVNLPSTLVEIENSAFQGSALSSITIPASVRKIGQQSFYCESISEMIFTPCDTAFTEPWLEIDDGCLGFNCNYGKIRSVTLPAHLKHVGQRSFCNPPVEEYKVAEGCRNYFAIDGVLYENGDTVTAYSYPLGRTAETWVAPKELSGGKIGKYFYDNNLNIGTPECVLKNLDFSQLTEPIKICTGAFSAPYFDELNLQNVYEVEDDAFDWGSIKSIYIGADMVQAGPGMICKSNPSFTVDAANPHYVEWNGSLCRKLTDGNLRLVQFHNPQPNQTGSTVEISENIVEIGKKAFYASKNIKEIKLPKTLRRIEECAFDVASDLATLTCESKVVDYVSGEAFGKHMIYASVLENFKGDVFMIGNWLFRWCKKIENPASVKFPKEATVIGEGAFSRNMTGSLTNAWNVDYFNNLTTITIPDQIVRIEQAAFYATPLQSVNLPEGIRIGNYSFGNTALTSLNLPAKLDSIGDGAFRNCKIEEITVPERVKYVGINAFGNNPAKKLTIGRANSAFETVVDEYAFSQLNKVETVYIGNNVISVGTGAFQNLAGDAPNPVEIELDGVREIGTSAFYGANIEKFTIGSNLERIHAGAFNVKHEVQWDWESGVYPAPIIGGSSVLKNITIATANPPQFVKDYDNEEERLCEDVVYAMCSLTVPAGSQDAYQSATVWRPFFELNADNWINAGVESVATDVPECSCTLSGRSLEIIAADNTPVTVATIDGRVLYQGYGSANVELLPGIVIARVGSSAHKYIVH